MDRAELSRERIRERLRANAWSDGIVALLLLVFGFSLQVIAADGGAFEWSVRACVWAMRIGGVALGAIAVLSLLGVRWSLLVSFVASALIGGVFLCGGAVRVVCGETTAILYVVFGVLFLRNALRNRADYGAVRAASVDAEAAEWRDALPVPPQRSAASQLRQRMKHPASDTPAAEPVVRAEAAAPVPHASTERIQPPAPPPEQKDAPRAQPVSGSPPPEGFLAALAKNDDDDA